MGIVAKYFKQLKLFFLVAYSVLIIPGDKLSFPVIVLLFMTVIEIPELIIGTFEDWHSLFLGWKDILPIFLLLISWLFLLMNIFPLRMKFKYGRIFIALSVLFSYAFLGFCVKEIIRYSEPITLATLVFFLIASILLLVSLILNWKNKAL